MKTTILATCYAVNPYKGSEDAMGWNFVCEIAKYRNVIAITRENNREAIEKYCNENPNEIYQNIQFKYFDLPKWALFWKKGNRGAMLYFYLWQKFVVNFVKKENLQFDIAHNVNFHNDWTPTFLWKLGKPLVWGPVGHHPKISKQYFKYYSFLYYLKDRFTWLIKNLFWEFSLALHQSIKHANHIWCMNSDVPKVLHLTKNFSIYPSVASEDFSDGEKRLSKNFTVLSVGRFVPLKGFDLTLNAFAKFLLKIPKEERTNCQLTIIGTGKEKKLFQKLIIENQLQNNVEIIEWIERKSLMEKYKLASVFLFPSHEGAGMVVPEALSFALPIIALNNCGPGEFISLKTGFIIPQENYDKTTDELSNALLALFSDKNLLQNKSEEARKLYEEKFSWAKRGEYLNNIYKNIEK